MRIPDRWQDLTLGQLQHLMTTEDPMERVRLVAGLSQDQVRQIPFGEIQTASEHLENMPETSRHLPVLTLAGKTYGFIPDWDEFSTGEWIDLEYMQRDFWPNAHRIMALLYRPIELQFGDRYTIKKYTAREDSTPFKAMPADLFSGAMLFFWNTQRELLLNLEHSLMEAAEKVNSAASGDGITASAKSAAGTSTWTRLRSALFGRYSRTSAT